MTGHCDFGLSHLWHIVFLSNIARCLSLENPWVFGRGGCLPPRSPSKSFLPELSRPTSRGVPEVLAVWEASYEGHGLWIVQSKRVSIDWNGYLIYFIIFLTYAEGMNTEELVTYDGSLFAIFVCEHHNSNNCRLLFESSFPQWGQVTVDNGARPEKTLADERRWGRGCSMSNKFQITLKQGT